MSVSWSADPITVPLRVISAPRARASTTGVGRTLDAIALLGRVVTIAALLVLASTAGGVVDGVEPGETPTVISTIGEK